MLSRGISADAMVAIYPMASGSTASIFFLLVPATELGYCTSITKNITTDMNQNAKNITVKLGNRKVMTFTAINDAMVNIIPPKIPFER